MVYTMANHMIGIFGGTYDPIHNGHLYVAGKIMQMFPMKQIRFIPCYQPVHRNKPFATIEQRLKMVSLALKGHPEYVLDESEARRKGPSYTIETLQMLRKELGETMPLGLILGDAFEYYNQWYRWQEIINYAHIIVVQRSKRNILKNNQELFHYVEKKRIYEPKTLLQSPAGSLIWTDIVGLPISSTKIRERIANGKDVSKQVPRAVLNYIKENQIYQSSVYST